MKATMSKKGLAGRIIAIACLAAVATASIGMGSFAKYHQSVGIAGTDGDDGSKSPRVAEFFFTAEVSKDGGTAFTTEELAESFYVSVSTIKKNLIYIRSILRCNGLKFLHQRRLPCRRR